MTENKEPSPAPIDEFEGFEFDEFGYITDPSKVTDSATAEKLWKAGKMTTGQVNEAIAHKKYSDGLLNLDINSAQLLRDKEVINDEQLEEVIEYNDNPISWYIKDTGKQIVGGARDFAQETIETIHEFHNDFNLQTRLIEWIAGVEHQDAPLPEFMKLPEVDKSESDVGKAVRGVSQFLTGFVPMFGQMNKINKGRQTINAMTAGAITDFVGFDEHEARLSDLVQSVPALQNPVTEYLQSDKDDSMYEGKLKNALEGLGIGVAIDGVLLGLKAVKSNIWAKNNGEVADIRANVQDITGKADVEDTVVAPKDETPVKSSEPKDETEQVISQVVKESEPEVASQTSKETLDERPITEKLITPEDVNKMIETGLKSEKKDIPSQSHIVTKRLADEYGVDFDVIAKTSKDVEGLAQRVHVSMKVLDDYTSQLKEELKVFLDESKNGVKPDTTKAMELFDKVKFHGGLQKTVRGISANVGRALNAHQIKVGDKYVDFKHVKDGDKDELLKTMGGESNIYKTLETFYEVLESGSKRDINRFSKQLNDYKLGNFIHGTWLSGILSGIGTQVVNLTGNSLNIALESLEHTVAVTGRTTSSILKGEGIDSFKHFNEITARYQGMGQGFLDAFRFFKVGDNGFELEAGNFWKVLKENEPLLDSRMKIEDNVTHNMPTYFSAGRAEREEYYKTLSFGERNMNRAVGIFGDAITIPLRFLSASDEAFKSIMYKSELMRSAVEEANNRGLKGADAKKFMKRYVEEPNPAVHQRGIDVARETTFTTPVDPKNNISATKNPLRHKLGMVGTGVDSFASNITKMKHTPVIQHVAKYLVPFITTPLNIVKHVGRRSPLAVFSRRWQEDILAGGTRRAQAYSKLLTGVGAVIAVNELYDRGLVTGRIPKHIKEGYKGLEIPDYSIRVGDKYYDYSRLDPVGMMIGLITDTKMAFDMAEVDPQMEEKIWSNVTMAFMSNMVNKTYMKGVSDFINMVNDPERYKPEDYGANLLSSMIPYSSAIGQYTSSNDPYYREAKTVNEYIRKKIDPQSLEPKLNIFGEPIKRTPRIAMAFDSNDITDDEVLKEIYLTGANIGESSDKLDFEGTKFELDIKQHNAFKRAVGATGVKEELRELINSPEYQAIEDYEVRAGLIKNIYSMAKSQAKEEFILNNPEFKDKVISGMDLQEARVYDKDLAEVANRKYHPIPALNKIRKEIEDEKDR